MAVARRHPESGEMLESKPAGAARLRLAHVFTYVEDAAYLSLGVMLTACGAVVLYSGAAAFWGSIRGGASIPELVLVLDRLLLVLMIIELLYTVKVSFREHTLVPEPFLIVGLIAVTRRILIVTAQLAVLVEKPNEDVFRSSMWELGVLTVMVVSLVGSLLMLRKRSATPTAGNS
jgi:uncharacterized membrane protein (DUF373 family)